MTKRLFFILMLFLILCSSSWAIWEGNGGTGSAADFPSDGLFVKSDMFPKHTLLEIINLEKNISARAVVIGPSGIPGLLTIFSPKLGHKLGVSADRVARIRVFIPSPVKEFGDEGLISSERGIETNDADSNPALFVASHDLPKEEPKTPEKEETDKISLYDEKGVEEKEVLPPVAVEKKNEVKEVAKTEEKIEPLPPPADKTLEEKPVKNETPEEVQPVKEAPSAKKNQNVAEVPILKKEVPVHKESVPETVPPIVTTAFMEPADEKPPVTVGSIKKAKKEEPQAEKKVEEIKTPAQPQKKEEDSFSGNVKNVNTPQIPQKEDVKNEPRVMFLGKIKEPVTLVEEMQEEVKEVSSIVQPKKEKKEDPFSGNVKNIKTPQMYQKETVKDEPEVMLVDNIKEPVTSLEKKKEEVKEVSSVIRPKEKAVEEKSVKEVEKVKHQEPEKEKSLEDETENITEKTDEPETSNQENTVKEEPEQTGEPDDADSKTEKEDIQQENPSAEESKDENSEVYEVKPENVKPDTPAVKDKLPATKTTLEKGNLYVQIVLYNDKKQAEAVVKTYMPKYPMLMEEKIGINKKRYIVFVGPLKSNEAGAVAERFKSLGFKDAFIKKVK